MYLQGELQKVFDALYRMGVIDPVLDTDWHSALQEKHRFAPLVDRAIDVINQSPGIDQMIEGLSGFDQKVLHYVAIEVAREFADFHSRGDLQ